MKHRALMWAVVSATTLTPHFERVQAFSPGNSAIVRVPRRESPLVQVQDQPNALFRGVGVVTAIDPATGSLTINHQEIVGLMPPMEMMFHVDPRTSSDDVKPGDKIEFGVEGKTYTVRDLRVIEHTK
ncbi:MAG TPA: copper-binding protein [Bradyrhizobium sp.]|nr:copper-binding protein [Bradyrhizobium sp.]